MNDPLSPPLSTQLLQLIGLRRREIDLRCSQLFIDNKITTKTYLITIIGTL